MLLLARGLKVGGGWRRSCHLCGHLAFRLREVGGTSESLRAEIRRTGQRGQDPRDDPHSHIEAHMRLNHSRLKTYEPLRMEVVMLLETNIGASLRAPEAAAGATAAGDDPMDTSGLWKGKGGKGQGKDKGNQKRKQGQKNGSGTGKPGATPAAWGSSGAASKDIVCHNCGRKGHKKADCWRPGGGSAGKGGKGKQVGAVEEQPQQPEPSAA
eukprot:4110176-Amphidinium_carterae.1